MIRFEDLKFSYTGAVLFEHFTETIRTGEKVVVTGASGAGKSTLLGCVAGFTLPGQGKVYVDDLVVNERNVTAVRSKLAWLPQEFSLPYQYVDEMINALFHLRVNKDKQPQEPRILEIFSELGLSADTYKKRLTELSGGQRQRVMLAIAVLLDKEIILLDEPTSALDADAVGNVIRFLQGLEGKTMIAVSHDATFIRSFDRVIKL